jgi:non-specific serine/threonine protein kinase/serine/threonine-protein kinase
MDSPPFSHKASPAARDVFLSFLLAHPEAADDDVDALCARRHELAAELRALWAEWQAAASPAPAAAARQGFAAAPGISLRPIEGERDDARPVERSPRATSDTRYEIEGELGRGGMGAVLKVWDPELRRHLAMKVSLERATPARRPSATASVLARFVAEAQITGQLEHPGIVPVHEMGLDASGRLFFTMRMVRGQDLKRVFELAGRSEEGWTTTRVVGVLLKVCEALSYAHARGVLHRDLKPANVMVGAFGEVYVMDWGLARVLDAEVEGARSGGVDGTVGVDTARTRARRAAAGAADSPLFTRDGDVVGTPAYMSPEQARGDLASLSARSDVYAVGAMLYHLLAGAAPYLREGETANAATMLARVFAGPPRPIAEVNADVPSELAAICEKAMARDPLARYADMRELREDLQNYLEGRVVRAYETGAVAELRKWVRRNRALATASAAAVLAIIAGLSGVSYTEAKRRSEVEAESTKVRQEATTSALVVDFLGGMFEQANPYATGGESITARAVLDAAVARIGTELANEPGVRARLLTTMGNAYRALGLYAESERLLEQALDLRRTQPGADEEDTLASIADLAWLEERIGSFAAAENHRKEALVAWERLTGPSSRPTLRARSLLAGLYHAQGRQTEGEPLARSTLESQAKLFGEEDPDTLLTMGYLIGFDLGMERFDEAEMLARRAFDAQRVRHGPEHRETIQALSELARVIALAGRCSEAEPRFGELLELQRRVCGEKSAEVLSTQNNLAYCDLQAGRFDVAERRYADVAESARESFGDFHEETIRAQSGLAEVYRRQGRSDESEALYQRLVNGLSARVAEDNPTLVGIWGALARLYESTGRYAEAEPILRRVLEHTPVSHPRYALRRSLLDTIERKLADERAGDNSADERR